MLMQRGPVIDGFIRGLPLLLVSKGQGIGPVSQVLVEGAIELSSLDLLSYLSKVLVTKVVFQQSKGLRWESLVEMDGPIQCQVDGPSSPMLGVRAPLSVSPQLSRLVTTNAILPLLPELAIGVDIVC